MTKIPRSRKWWRGNFSYRKLCIVTLIVIFELACALTAHFVLRELSNRKVRREMVSLTDRAMQSVKGQVERFEFQLLRNSAFMEINGRYITQENYDKLMQVDNNPDRQGIEANIVILRITTAEVPRYNRFCAQRGCVLQQSVDNTTFATFEPVDARLVYYPLLVTSPKEYAISSNNMSLKGLDLSTTENTRSVLKQLVDAKQKVTLGQRYPEQYAEQDERSFSIVMACVVGNSFSAPIGFQLLLFKPERMFRDAVANINLGANDVTLSLFDISQDGVRETNNSLIFHDETDAQQNVASVADVTSTADSNLLVTIPYSILSRKYIALFQYTDAFVRKRRSRQDLEIVLIVSGLLALLNIVMLSVYLLKRKTRRLRVFAKQSEVANKMLSYVNHELRNPLNIIKNLVLHTIDRLKDIDKSREVASGYVAVHKTILDTSVSDLSTVSGACDMVEHVITDILSVQKLEAGNFIVEYKKHSIAALVEDIKRAVIQKIEEKGNVKLVVTLSRDASTMIVDQFRLKQIMISLLSNSIKYTERGQIELSAKRLGVHGDTVRFSVRDTGIGISDTSKQHIFEPYTQYGAHDVDNNLKGIGLGLYLSKMLTTRMGGTIGFTSELHNGSTFWIDLPDPPPEELMQHQEHWLQSPEQLLSANVYLKTEQHLIVDDSTFNRLILRRILKGLNLEIEEACNGQECVDKVKEHGPYSIIWMDLCMPVMDGLSALKHLRNKMQYSGVVICVTGFAGDESAEAHLKAGFDHYCTKPLSAATVHAYVERYSV